MARKNNIEKIEVTCKICGKKYNSWGGLATHIHLSHPEYTSQSYYDEFLATKEPMGTFRNIRVGYIGADPHGNHECQICGTRHKSLASLAKHIQHHHKEYSSQTYYDEFMLVGVVGCVVCGKPVPFLDITKGYRKTCGHSCACKYHRAKLAEDEEKHAAFVAKVAKNQAAIWAEREKDGTKDTMFADIGAKIKANCDLLTEEERSAKFGWLNKLEGKAREEAIEKVIAPLRQWYKDVDEETLREYYDYRALSNRANNCGMTVEEYQERISKPPTREAYYESVWLYTERTYKRNIDVLDPERKRSVDWHLDHKYSIVRGWAENVPPEIIGSIHNLELLLGTENVTKNAKCSINKETLLELYHGKELLKRDI